MGYGIGIGVRDREWVRDREYGVVQGVRGEQGLGYGWVVVRVVGCMEWGKRVGLGWDWVGLGYGWVGIRDGGGVCTGVLGMGRFWVR